jgi:hypothetical protein
MYECSYCLSFSGEYCVRISVNDREIPLDYRLGNTAILHSTGAIDPLQSRATGDCFSELYADDMATFELALLNTEGRPMHLPLSREDNIKVVVMAVGTRPDVPVRDQPVAVRVSKNAQPGSYSVSFCPPMCKQVRISIQFRGTHFISPSSPAVVSLTEHPYAILYNWRPILGLELGSQTHAVKGVKVTAVRVGGPSHRAGITSDCYLRRLHNTFLTSAVDYRTAMKSLSAGDSIEVEVWLGKANEQLKTTIQLGGAARDGTEVDSAVLHEVRSRARVNGPVWDRNEYVERQLRLESSRTRLTEGTSKLKAGVKQTIGVQRKLKLDTGAAEMEAHELLSEDGVVAVPQLPKFPQLSPERGAVDIVLNPAFSAARFSPFGCFLSPLFRHSLMRSSTIFEQGPCVPCSSTFEPSPPAARAETPSTVDEEFSNRNLRSLVALRTPVSEAGFKLLSPTDLRQLPKSKGAKRTHGEK